MTFPMCRAPTRLTLVVALLAALAGTADADMTVSQSNDPALAPNADLSALPGAERSALGAMGGAWLQALVARPARGKKAEAGDLVAFDETWLAAQPAAAGDAEFECLVTALYFEARGETVKGQAAVAEVILNRAESPDFPHSVCGVVNQGNANGCQFSYTCDGRKDAIGERDAWDRAAKIARAMLDGAPRSLTEGATHFHTPAVRPDWSRRFERTAKIGRHIFYRAPIRTAMN